MGLAKNFVKIMLECDGATSWGKINELSGHKYGCLRRIALRRLLKTSSFLHQPFDFVELIHGEPHHGNHYLDFWPTLTCFFRLRFILKRHSLACWGVSTFINPRLVFSYVVGHLFCDFFPLEAENNIYTIVVQSVIVFLSTHEEMIRP